MDQRVPCATPGCHNTIQSATARRNNGLCGPCAAGRKPSNESKPPADERPVETLLGQFFYDRPIALDSAALNNVIAQALPETEYAPISGGTSVLLVHHGHLVTFKDGRLPAQSAILSTGRAPDPVKLAPSFRQTWNWPDAKSIVAQARDCLVVSEMMSRPLPTHQRLDLFATILRCVAQVHPPIAAHWPFSEKFASPQEFRDAANRGTRADWWQLMVNVRLFRIDGTQDDTVMDTLGLCALGLPDVQMHSHGLVANQVAAVLYSLAAYLLEQGDCIQDGHTVQGFAPSDRWVCRHEMSLVKPERVVLDVRPGPTHAAGARP